MAMCATATVRRLSKPPHPEQAEPLYDYFNNRLCSEYGLHVETGRFGADMQVDFVNDGPVTILIDSANR